MQIRVMNPNIILIKILKAYYKNLNFTKKNVNIKELYIQEKTKN
jgi:hypothetical protein